MDDCSGQKYAGNSWISENDGIRVETLDRMVGAELWNVSKHQKKMKEKLFRALGRKCLGRGKYKDSRWELA